MPPLVLTLRLAVRTWHGAVRLGAALLPGRLAQRMDLASQDLASQGLASEDLASADLASADLASKFVAGLAGLIGRSFAVVAERAF